MREVGYEMHELDGWHGRRVLVNGQKIFCRGGYIQPELLFDWDARRMETEIRYYAEANLNLIYFEDIPNPPDAFLDAVRPLRADVRQLLLRLLLDAAGHAVSGRSRAAGTLHGGHDQALPQPSQPSSTWR